MPTINKPKALFWQSAKKEIQDGATLLKSLGAVLGKRPFSP